MRGGRDYVAIALATAGVLAAISLAGIFVVYLIDTIGGDDKPATAQVVGTSVPTGATATGATGPTLGAAPGGAGAALGGKSAPGAGAGNAAAGAGGAGQGGQRANRISDNQQYDTFTSKSAGYSISYPQGWERSGDAKNTSFHFRLDFLHVIIAKGGKPTVERVRTGLQSQKGSRIISPPTEVVLNGSPAIKATVAQKRTNNGKVTARIFIDQYRTEKSGRTAAIDIGCPAGVYADNQDDFKRMAESFRWL